MTTSEKFDKFNLQLAISYIEDDEPTLAFEVDGNDEVYNLKTQSSV